MLSGIHTIIYSQNAEADKVFKFIAAKFKTFFTLVAVFDWTHFHVLLLLSGCTQLLNL